MGQIQTFWMGKFFLTTLHYKYVFIIVIFIVIFILSCYCYFLSLVLVLLHSFLLFLSFQSLAFCLCRHLILSGLIFGNLEHGRKRGRRRPVKKVFLGCQRRPKDHIKGKYKDMASNGVVQGIRGQKTWENS